MKNCIYQRGGVLKTLLGRHHWYNYTYHDTRQPYSLYICICRKKIGRDSPPLRTYIMYYYKSRELAKFRNFLQATCQWDLQTYFQSHFIMLQLSERPPGTKARLPYTQSLLLASFSKRWTLSRDLMMSYNSLLPGGIYPFILGVSNFIFDTKTHILLRHQRFCVRLV